MVVVTSVRDRIAIVVRKGIEQLLCGPGCCRMFGDRHVDDPSTVVGEEDEDEEQPEGDGRHHEQVGSHDLARMNW